MKNQYELEQKRYICMVEAAWSVLCRQSVKWGQRHKNFVSRHCRLVQRLCLSLDLGTDVTKGSYLYN